MPENGDTGDNQAGLDLMADHLPNIGEALDSRVQESDKLGVVVHYL